MIRLERQSSDGAWYVSLAGPYFHRGLQEPGGWPTVYGYGSFLQLSSDRAAALVNRRVLGEPITDFEDGADLFVFDSLETLASSPPIPISRGQRFPPQRGLTVVTRCITRIGGVVPLDAGRPNGRPHPAAGTGFILASHGPLAAHPRPHPDAAVAGEGFQELIQIRYDGHTVTITDRFRYRGPELLPHLITLSQGLSPAIPDGDNLLTGVSAGPVAPGIQPDSPAIPCFHPHAHPRLGRNVGACFCRWRYGSKGWRPVEVVPVSGPDLAMEPSLIRLPNGILLMSVRGKGLQEPPGSVTEGLENTYDHFRVYRSDDNGTTWRSLIHLPRMRNATPVVLNRTAGGTPFLTANPYQALRDSHGRIIPSTMTRNRLALWPVEADQGRLGERFLLLDADQTFGPPPSGSWEPYLKTDNLWSLDHPIAGPIRLADGRWHTLMAFRVTHAAVNHAGAEPAPEGGFWIAEIEKSGETPVPLWPLD